MRDERGRRLVRYCKRRLLFLVWRALRIVSKNWAVRVASLCGHLAGMASLRARRKNFLVRDENRDGVRAPKGYDSVSKEAGDADKIVVDDWPADVPITAAEVDVLEIFLRDLLDAFLRRRH